MSKPKKQTSPTEPILEVTQLTREFDGPHGRLKILRGVEFSAMPAEMMFILGRSGSGKTTLLNLLGGFDKPTSGMIRFRGEDIARFGQRRVAEFRRNHVGFVFQFYHLLSELTLLENVMLPTIIARDPKPKQAERLLRRVGLIDRKDHYPSQLSGGEQQRAAIARSLVNDPELVLCDEPTGNLDEETAKSVFNLLVELNEEEKKTFIIVTHEASLIKKGNAMLRLHDGFLEPV